ncbi:hypothetical protein V5735_01855 (plasmid) [Haladaptatus sp. SPP-AMP-3]|uniref:hypothetical protein n=1 Tax=Haladaptatus sp. SPP-AMP-3 TaxID=3121295 RepID=UPI003C30EA94
MDWEFVTCEECGQPYSVRVREDGTYVLPTDAGECERCGCTEFSRVTGVVGDD